MISGNVGAEPTFSDDDDNLPLLIPIGNDDDNGGPALLLLLLLGKGEEAGEVGGSDAAAAVEGIGSALIIVVIVPVPCSWFWSALVSDEATAIGGAAVVIVELVSCRTEEKDNVDGTIIGLPTGEDTVGIVGRVTILSHLLIGNLLIFFDPPGGGGTVSFFFFLLFV
jgi:hypothetical protein